MTDEQLDVPGFGAYPCGLDPQIPFIGIVRWVNRELIHHLAEVALMRDLHAVSSARFRETVGSGTSDPSPDGRMP